MIIFTKCNLENDEQYITDIIKKEKELITSEMESQNTLKSILLDYMQELVDSTDNVDSNNSNDILDILQKSKNTLDLFKINQDLLNNLLELLDNIVLDICDKDRILDSETINNFNTAFFDLNDTVSKNTILVENFLQSTSQFLKFTFETKYDNSINNNIPSSGSEKVTVSEVPVNKDLAQSNGYIDIVENTLIISKAREKVFLPYTISSLNDILRNNPNKYSSIEDIIEKKYTLPFDLFKNPAIARFREAFHLMRKKEKKSIRDAFDLGMELLFNSNLHPAIIAACKNLDELDTYLEYLENNETSKFDCFKIIFDISPVSIK